MSKYYILLITITFSFIFSKVLIPSNGSSIILKDEKKEYVYYELNKNGLEFDEIGKGYSIDDSVRIKLFVRYIVADSYSEEKDFKISYTINKNQKKTLRFEKTKSRNLTPKDRPQWSCTKAGLWFIDISVKDFNRLVIQGNKKSIVKASINKINRKKYSTVKSVRTINRETRYIIDTKTRDENKELESTKVSSYWYKLNSSNDELQFEVEGPTSIRIFTRLSSPSTNSKDNSYNLFIKENGLDIGTFYFNSEISSLSSLRSSGGKVGKWRTCWINVPKGKYYYTIRSGGLKENPIFIKVKQYDK